MRFSLSLVALIAACPALAEEVTLRADIVSGTIYGEGAELTRQGSVDLPAGTHRLLIAMPDMDLIDFMPRVQIDGARLIGAPERVGAVTIAEGALDLPDQAAARDAVEAARDAVEAAQAEIDAGEAHIQAAETQLAYLQGLTRGDQIAFPEDAEALSRILATLGSETARAAEELRAARAAQLPRREAMDDAVAALGQADQALRRLMPFGPSVSALAIEVDLAEAGEVGLTLDYLSYDASWQPGYSLDLDSQTGTLEVERSIQLVTPGRERWLGVDLDFSTADPNRQRIPRDVRPDVANIFEPRDQAPRRSADLVESEALAGAMAEAMVEPVVIVEDTAGVVFDGLSLTYDYQNPVTVTGSTELPFDMLEFDTDLTRLAAPRHHDTAFLLAEFENDIGEALIPGEARFYRDGALIGDGYLDLIAAGAEAELAFGPVDHLILDWQDLSRDAGDTGFFVQSNTEERRVRFSVENTSGEEETVRLVYATPFSEVEDLEVEVSLSQAPTEENIDDLRGVHAWEITLAPGEVYDVEMAVSFDWPDGQVLGWRP